MWWLSNTGDIATINGYKLCFNYFNDIFLGQVMKHNTYKLQVKIKKKISHLVQVHQHPSAKDYMK